MKKNPAKVAVRHIVALMMAWGLFAADLQGADKHRTGYLLTPKAFRAAAEKVIPSIVTIETYGDIARPSGGGGGISRPGDGPTTGLIISADGYIITSTFNFIKKPQVITVILDDGSRHVAELKGRDKTRKICILKIDGVKDLSVPKLVPRESVRVGQWAISVGVGYGDDDPAISAGLVSAASRISGKAIQTDANISPANYGGPLVDIEGNVIGVCVPLAPGSSGPSGAGDNAMAGVEWYDSGIGFAVPLHGIDRLLAQMKEGKEIHPGRVGIMMKPATSEEQGVMVGGIAPKSPAAKAKIQKGDHLLAVNGEDLFDVQHLKVILGRFAAGDKIKITLKRGDEQLEVELVLAKSVQPPKPQKTPPKKPAPKKPAPKKPAPKEPAAGTAISVLG